MAEANARVERNPFLLARSSEQAGPVAGGLSCGEIRRRSPPGGLSHRALRRGPAPSAVRLHPAGARHQAAGLPFRRHPWRRARPALGRPPLVRSTSVREGPANRRESHNTENNGGDGEDDGGRQGVHHHDSEKKFATVHHAPDQGHPLKNRSSAGNRPEGVKGSGFRGIAGGGELSPEIEHQRSRQQNERDEARDAQSGG